VRRGDWKLIEFSEDGALQLCNLRTDPRETNNLAKSKPALAEELLQDPRAWRVAVGAQMPTPNPNYDATTTKRPANQ